MLLQRGNQGEHGAVGVGRLGGDVNGRAARARIDVGHAATGFHGRRVAALVVGALGDRHLGVLKGCLGGLLVAGLPIEDMIVLLPFRVVAQKGRAGVQRLRPERAVADRGQRDKRQQG